MRWCLVILARARIERHASGRQLASFVTTLACPALGPASLEAVFIRAPILRAVGPGVQVLAERETPVLVRDRNVLAATFHPELTADRRVHEQFLQDARRHAPVSEPAPAR